ncbi:MAG: hypothetical protein ABIF77_11510 [bacterium]
MFGLLLLLGSQPAAGLVQFDFEQLYYVHPQQQIWDFCLVQPDSTCHLFYCAVPEATPGAANADTIWHAVSTDLTHWSLLGPVLHGGPDWWDREAVWAPDVVFDPDRQLWVMAYTGVDSLMVQRPCLALSPDLTSWSKETVNPVFEPDSLVYYWSPQQAWSSFRDPFLFEADGLWHQLNTAGLRLGSYPGYSRGILHHLTSPDLRIWSDAGIFFEHDGSEPWRDLESCQYVIRGDWHHLFVTELNINQTYNPTTHLVSENPAGWTMAERQTIDLGWAPEIEPLANGNDCFARLAKDQDPRDFHWFITVRLDTLVFADGGATPQIRNTHPLAADWLVRKGISAEVNPTFGDNPVWRDEPSCGLEGNGWFGSAEYYQGPLSGHGSPGGVLGDIATCELVSIPFVISGNRMRLLVGGGHYPQTCYVALLDVAADTLLCQTTGDDDDTMSERIWNLEPFLGRLAAVTIVDKEQGPFGHINVDSIEEYLDLTGVRDGGTPTVGRDLGPRPNPANPGSTLQFVLNTAGTCRLTVHDIRGRIVWQRQLPCAAAGLQSVTWSGKNNWGRPVPAAVYLYRIEQAGRLVGQGKIAIVK